MTKTTKKIQGVTSIMDTIFSALKALQIFAPEYKWKGLGNVLGDYGECIAIDHYKLKKAPPGSEGFDAHTKDGKTVQIKANYSAKMIGYRGKADLLLVIGINENGSWNEVYFGDFKTVIKKSSKSKRDNKKTISITKLKKMNKPDKLQKV